jgi:hypothetical protein
MSEELINALEELRIAQEEFKEKYEAENDAWWDDLTLEEQEHAFYAVCKRIHQADLEDHGTYRWTIYDVFGFGPSAYGLGVDCGYLNIHNAIIDGEEYQKLTGVNRFEVIDSDGRSYVKYLGKDEGIKYSLQDDDKTLKVFIDKESWKKDL